MKEPSIVKAGQWIARIFALPVIICATSFCPKPAGAAIITTITSLPGDTPGDLFDVSNPGNSYSLGPSTTLNASGYDARDLFGGELDPYAPERGGVVFGDNQPIGTVETVNVLLPSPVSINNFALYINEDSNNTGDRSTREFKLFSGTTLIDDVTILDNTGTQSYKSVYGGYLLKITDTLTGVPSNSTYTLEFFQNQNASTISGLRATEFDANVPEPASFTLLGLTSFGLLARKTRRAN